MSTHLRTNLHAAEKSKGSHRTLYLQHVFVWVGFIASDTPEHYQLMRWRSRKHKTNKKWTPAAAGDKTIITLCRVSQNWQVKIENLLYKNRSDKFIWTKQLLRHHNWMYTSDTQLHSRIVKLCKYISKWKRNKKQTRMNECWLLLLSQVAQL